MSKQIFFDDLLKAYRVELAGVGRAHGTITLRISHIRRCLEYVNKPLCDIEREDIMNWLAANSWGAAARASARASVQGFWRWLAETGRAKDIAAGIPRPKQPRAVPKPASDDAILEALAAAPDDLRMAIEIMATAGLRRAECAKVRASDVIQVPSPMLRVVGKGGHERLIPIPRGLADRIAARGGFLFPGQDHGHISPGYLGKRISKILPEGVTPHHLRHRYATTIYRSTGDLRAVQSLLGHASVATTQIYVALDLDQTTRVASTAWKFAS